MSIRKFNLLMMPYGGGANGGGSGLPGGVPSLGGGNGVIAGTAAITSITKTVKYVAGDTDSNLVLAIAGTDSITATTADAPKSIVIHNTGNFPLVALLGYESYSDEDTDAGTLYLHVLINPGESIYPPMRAVIPTANTLRILDGEVVDYTAPNTNLYTDSTADVDDVTGSGIIGSATNTTVYLEDGHSNFFRVGDLIRITNEIMEVTAVGTGADLANSTLTVKRAVHGSAAASDHADDDAVLIPFFNEYYDFDRVLSGNTQLVQTDGLGRFKCSNFFGYGRVDSSSAPFGIVPGSVCIRFYTSAYMDIPMGGTGVAGGTGGSNIPITSSTSSLLTASTEYSLNLIIDDSVETTVSFTTDTSNVNFGGTNGVIRKIQDAIDTATRTAGNNLFGYSCTVSIADGNLRFTSNSHLLPHDGTNGSKIGVLDGAGGTNVLTGAAGIFPDINNSIAAVKPKLPDLNVYDSITYATSPNMVNICYDDSYGNLRGAATGKISYETGAISFTGLANASFEVSVIHNSPYSGKLDANKADANTLQAIHANTLNKNMVSEIKVEAF